MKTTTRSLLLALLAVSACGDPLETEPPAIPDEGAVRAAATAVKPSPAAKAFLETAWNEDFNQLAWPTCASFRIAPRFHLTVFANASDLRDAKLLIDWKTADGIRIQQIVSIDRLLPVISRAGNEFEAKFTVGGQPYLLNAYEAGASVQTPTEEIPMVCALE